MTSKQALEQFGINLSYFYTLSSQQFQVKGRSIQDKPVLQKGKWGIEKGESQLSVSVWLNIVIRKQTTEKQSVGDIASGPGSRMARNKIKGQQQVRNNNLSSFLWAVTGSLGCCQATGFLKLHYSHLSWWQQCTALKCSRKSAKFRRYCSQRIPEHFAEILYLHLHRSLVIRAEEQQSKDLCSNLSLLLTVCDLGHITSLLCA